jgi:DNA adenine methylase
MHASSVSFSVRPLLKWAGGKRQLLPALRQYYPGRFTRYIEPFVGSGAVFFDLFSLGRLEGVPTRLTDVNVDLLGTYRVVRDRTEEVLRVLARLDRDHRRDGETCYYRVRDRRFNPLRQAVVADGPHAALDAYPVDLAAMFIYLNRTGFNGLFRLNRSGQFNVPVGRYAAPRICDADHLRAVAAAFRRSQAQIEFSPFDATLADAGRGDFVYCDPPYAPLSPTANFAHYTAGGFSADDQLRLRDAIVAACERGATVVESNSSAGLIEDAYRTAAARRVQLKVERVAARRAINSRASARGPVDELIIANVRPMTLPGKKPMLKATLGGRRTKVRTA